MDAVEAAIVGGGPAGMSAGLILGRCRRRTVVLDSGVYRNDRSRHVHGFLGRDGVAPAELRAIGRRELARYPSVEILEREVLDVVRADDGFVLELAGGGRLASRAVLLATGLVDVLPPLAGAAELIGEGLYPCPYCDGWEHRDGRFAIYAPASERGERFARTLGQWAAERVFHPAPGPRDEAVLARLERGGVAVDRRDLARVVRDGERGVRLEGVDGAAARYDAMFFSLGARQRSPIAERLGCEMADDEGVEVSRRQETCVPGCYVAGDASRDVLEAIVAAGEGAAAAVMMNGYLGRMATANAGR